MNVLRRLLVGLLVALGALGLTGSAYAQPAKLYGLLIEFVSGPPSSPGAEVTLRATFKNLSPNKANSSFNALRLVPPGPVQITSITSPAGGVVDQNIIKFENLSPVGKDASFVITFRAILNSGGCSGIWNPDPPTDDVWTGSQLGSGNTFEKVINATYPSTIGGSPSIVLGITYPPGEATTSVVASPPSPGYAMTATVKDACGFGIPNVPVVLTLSNVTANPQSPVTTNANGVASFTASFGTASTASVKATALGVSDTKTFMVFAAGPLKCEPYDPYIFVGSPQGVQPGQPGSAVGMRGPWNKSGDTCVPVAYTFTNSILTNNSALLSWDAASQPGATFQYTVTWKPEYVDLSAGLPTRKNRVAWYVNGSLTPLVQARGCLSSSLPGPYGTLDNAIGAANGTLVITLSPPAPMGQPQPPTPPATPFAIVIGLERMTVTAISGNQWSVTRGVGSTAAAHSAGDSVMSTPLPLDSSGNIMRMCVADESWVVVPAGMNDCPTASTPSPTVPVPTVPQACVLFTTTFFDLGDGFINRDF